MVALLLENNADINARDVNNRTSCDLVQRNGIKKEEIELDSVKSFQNLIFILSLDRETIWPILKCAV